MALIKADNTDGKREQKAGEEETYAASIPLPLFSSSVLSVPICVISGSLSEAGPELTMP
jgi:hypothetical protein